MKSKSERPTDQRPFPTFASLAEAEAYSDKTGDAYFEICYHLEGKLNLCLKAMHDLYANAPSGKRAKMQSGIVREEICPEGWPKHPRTLIYTLAAFGRFRHEATCHAYTVNEALTARVFERKNDKTVREAVYNPDTFEPMTAADAEDARRDLLRLCDWIESRLHAATHAAWYDAPDCFSDDPEKAHLANIGIGQRYLANFSERDRERWHGILERAAEKHKGDLKAWGTVGKVQYDPQPRTWTHRDVDGVLIGLWPLVARYNWTYSDLLKVLDALLPKPLNNDERKYPLDSEDSLKMHCRTICGLTKSKKGKSADKMPEGWNIAARLFGGVGK